jgi:hypothetical protein
VDYIYILYILYVHIVYQTNQLNCKPHYEYTTAKLVLSCLSHYKRKNFSLHFALLHFSFVSLSPERKKHTHFSLHFISGFPNLVNSCQLLILKSKSHYDRQSVGRQLDPTEIVVSFQLLSSLQYCFIVTYYWLPFFFFFNPLLFASCTDTFSKWCKITRGMKRSAQ